jgi:ribonuclease Z
VAARAGVRQLVLTHFSARYSRDASQLLNEAKEEFNVVVLARDGLEIEIPFQEEAVSGQVASEGKGKG